MDKFLGRGKPLIIKPFLIQLTHFGILMKSLCETCEGKPWDVSDSPGLTWSSYTGSRGREYRRMFWKV